MLPTLTTFVIGAPLALLPNGTAWWVGFAFSAVLLTGVFLAEYITIDASAPPYAIARAGLTALAYALFLILVTSLRFSGARMFLLVPVIFIVAALISLRILHLDGTDRWDFPWAIGIGFVCAQIGAGLHYWPLTPIQFGLALTGPLYALTMLSANLTENIPLRRAALGPAIIVGTCLGFCHLFTIMQSLSLTKEHLQQMIAHVDSHAPLEACGLLAGLNSKVETVLEVTNQAQSAVRFVMDPIEQLNAFEWIESNGHGIDRHLPLASNWT